MFSPPLVILWLTEMPLVVSPVLSLLSFPNLKSRSFVDSCLLSGFSVLHCLAIASFIRPDVALVPGCLRRGGGDCRVGKSATFRVYFGGGTSYFRGWPDLILSREGCERRGVPLRDDEDDDDDKVLDERSENEFAGTLESFFVAGGAGSVVSVVACLSGVLVGGGCIGDLCVAVACLVVSGGVGFALSM